MAIVVLVKYQVQDGKLELAKRELAALINTVTATEQECQGISMLDDGAHQVLLYERWTDRETYFGPHMRTPHIEAFIESAGRFLDGPPDISVWQEA